MFANLSATWTLDRKYKTGGNNSLEVIFLPKKDPGQPPSSYALVGRSARQCSRPLEGKKLDQDTFIEKS